MNHAVVGATVAIVGLLGGYVGFYVGAASRPVEKRVIQLETRALSALIIAVVLIVAAGIAIAIKGP